MATYHWEVQRLRHGFWSNQAILGEPADPRGSEVSTDDPETFARRLADRLDLSGAWKLAVWDAPGVGRLPVAVLDGPA